jgi:hypothetical protein
LSISNFSSSCSPVPPPRSFYYDFSTSPPPPTFFAPINGADFESGQLVLNDDKPSINSAAYTSQQLWVNSFRANFTFLLGNSPNGHHGGFAFVVQADTLSKAGPNDAGIGYGSNPNTADPGLTHSLAIEFDTYVDMGVDDTPNCQAAPHFAAHTMGAGPNSAVESAANWNSTCFTQITNPYTQGNKVHNVTVVYLAPVLTVYYDEIVQPVLTVRLDLATQLGLTNGLAYVGFTASTGSQGGDRHAITSMAFDYLSALAPGSSAAAGVQPNQTAGAVGTFTLQAFDEFGHPYPFGGAAVLVNFSAVTDPDQLTYVVTDLKNGNYSVSFNITLAASGDLEVTMDGVLVKGMPTALQIVAGAVDAKWGNFSGALTYAEAGQSAQVTFLVFDHYRNPTSAPCSFTGTTLSNNVSSIDLGTPKETSPGQWSFTFVAKHTGHYFWNVVVNGVPFAEQPKPLWVSNGPASAANSTVAGLSSSFTAGTPQTCVLSVRDSEGNVFSENVTTSVSLRNATSTIAAVLQSFDESGDYTYTFTLYGAGTWIPSVLVVDQAVTSNVPAQLTVLSQAPLAASSDIVYGGAPIQTHAGDLIITVFEARDMYGNLISSNNGVTWNVLINAVAYPAAPSTATTGIWSVSWSPTVAATYTVTATIDTAQGAPPPHCVFCFPQDGSLQ